VDEAIYNTDGALEKLWCLVLHILFIKKMIAIICRYVKLPLPMRSIAFYKLNASGVYF